MKIGADIAQKYHYQAFKCPAPCYDCGWSEYSKDWHRITYKADYFTHRIDYHNLSPSLVQQDFNAWIEKTEGCCCRCNCESELEKKYKDLQEHDQMMTERVKAFRGREETLDKKISKVSLLKARIDSVYNDFKEEYNKC